jgi:curved DNA-binding protein CbpA
MTVAIADRGAAGLLGEQVASSASGILSVKRGKLKRLFCLDRGELVYVASNLIEEQLDEVLVRNKLLTPQLRAQARLESSRREVKLNRYLHDEKVVAPGVMVQALREHARELLLASMEFPDADWAFDSGRPDLAGEVTMRQSVIPLIFEHVAEHPASIDKVRVRIGPPDTRLAPGDRVEKLLDGVTLSPAAKDLLARCDGTKSVSALVAEAPQSSDEALRAVYGLLLVGLVEVVEEEKVVRPKLRDRVTREEALARLHQAHEADHYALLGVDVKASASDVRDAYYMLARRFHPDRFRTGEVADLLGQIEQFFTQVTEAYNTLHDVDLRGQYDEELTTQAAGKRKKAEADPAYLAKQNYARAKVLIGKRQFAASVQFLENAVKQDASNATYRLELGRVLGLNPRHRPEAEKQLKQAIELDPASVEAKHELGLLYRKMDRNEEAAAQFREVLNWEPTHAEAAEQLAELGGGKRGGR